MSDFEIENGILLKYIGNSETVKVPDGISVIADWAFQGCRSVKEIIIPNGVKSIGTGAFHACTSLKSVYIPDGVKTIEKEAFMECVSLTEVHIPNSLNKIGVDVFPVDHTVNIIMSPEHPHFRFENDLIYNTDTMTTVQYLGNGSNVKVPDGIIAIGISTFCECKKIISVILPNSLERIESLGFFRCTGLKRIDIPDGVVYIAKNAFHGCCSLLNITLSESLKTVENDAFYECRNLRSITIPKNVTEIGDTAFYGCYGLKSIYNYSSCPVAKTLPDSTNINKGYLPGETLKDLSAKTLPIAIACYLSSEDMYTENEKLIYEDYISFLNIKLIEKYMKFGFADIVEKILDRIDISADIFYSLLDMSAENVAMTAVLLEWKRVNKIDDDFELL